MMKNILSIFIAASLILLMGSCHSQKRDRKQNVVHFADVQSDEWLSEYNANLFRWRRTIVV